MKSIDIHQANVVGLGAKKFVAGVLDEIKSCDGIAVESLYVNKQLATEGYSDYKKIIHVGYFFGYFSRLAEIFLWRFFRKSNNEILILGDLPLNTTAKQYVLCHQSLIFESFAKTSLNFYKFSIFRLCFKFFLKRDDVVLVQTEEMAKKIKSNFRDDVNVCLLAIGSNHFGWPDFIRLKRFSRTQARDTFRVIYPSAFYPHKNHHLLNKISYEKDTEVVLTLEQNEFLSGESSLSYIGRVRRERVFEIYREADALLFLSSNESLGMPILEAIKCNLPIICPLADYTKHLSQENCFFFELEDPKTLEDALFNASKKIRGGWWPKWSFNEFVGKNARSRIQSILLGN